MVICNEHSRLFGLKKFKFLSFAHNLLIISSKLTRKEWGILTVKLKWAVCLGSRFHFSLSGGKVKLTLINHTYEVFKKESECKNCKQLIIPKGVATGARSPPGTLVPLPPGEVGGDGQKMTKKNAET